ncbi:ribonuclease HI [Desulfogranum japonicum]|uniref:ribonuclease HI n=1 Tax=Desulfogranum japonicum TaxID=231447 RepID=UPI000407267D|nr:ribonuclease HI [Desulfogranum japonicum]
MKQVEIYTDGGCLGNPGPGGYGAILTFGEHRKELSGGYALTTNNRMELMACIKALEALKFPCKVTITSDSKYVVDSMTKGWAKRWRANNWKRNSKDKAENPDLWAILLDLAEQHTVDFVWVKGHDGHTENERCDQLAKEAASANALEKDGGYDG